MNYSKLSYSKLGPAEIFKSKGDSDTSALRCLKKKVAPETLITIVSPKMSKRSSERGDEISNLIAFSTPEFSNRIKSFIPRTTEVFTPRNHTSTLRFSSFSPLDAVDHNKESFSAAETCVAISDTDSSATEPDIEDSFEEYTNLESSPISFEDQFTRTVQVIELENQQEETNALTPLRDQYGTSSDMRTPRCPHSRGRRITTPPQTGVGPLPRTEESETSSVASHI